jgi:hypothetical protein
MADPRIVNGWIVQDPAVILGTAWPPPGEVVPFAAMHMLSGVELSWGRDARTMTADGKSGYLELSHPAHRDPRRVSELLSRQDALAQVERIISQQS